MDGFLEVQSYGSICLPSILHFFKLPVPGRPTVWMIVGQGPIALAIGAEGGWFGNVYFPVSFLSSFSLSLGDGPRLSQRAALPKTTTTTT